MTERHELEPLVRDWLHSTLDTIPEPAHRYGLVAAEVNETSQQRSWLPTPLPGRPAFMGTFRLVAAAGIVALFGGFLLSGVLTSPQDRVILPAAETEAPGLAFPTGTFESDEGDLTLDLRADGTCERAGVPCTFGVNGGYYSEMSFEEPTGAQVPATYYWDFDGESLTFEPWGIDKRPDRRSAYADHVYHPVGGTLPLPDTDTDFPGGSFVRMDDSGTVALRFREDGKYTSSSGGSATYAVSGNLFTEMAFTPGSSGVELVPATYYWNWDGERLQFRLWGEDNNRWRTADLLGHVFIQDKAVSAPGEKRVLLLSHPRIDYWITVDLEKRGGQPTATATLEDGSQEVGVGDTAQEAVQAALEALGVPYAAEITGSI